MSEHSGWQKELNWDPLWLTSQWTREESLFTNEWGQFCASSEKWKGKLYLSKVKGMPRQLIRECQSVNNLAYFAIQPLNLDTNFVLFNCPPSLGCAHQMKMKKDICYISIKRLIIQMILLFNYTLKLLDIWQLRKNVRSWC